ncbi:MAG: FtsH protease activity modulator HflK [Thermodesulfobacteria bacterium]|nr:FtsH protease activity modulator HflK [Thermodesulfobacteriota bacterium]
MEVRKPTNFRPPNTHEIKKQFRSAFPIVIILLVGIIIWNCWYTIEPEEVGLVLRFGKFQKETQPGLHFKLPYPIEQVIKIPVQRQLKEEFGFRTEVPGVRTKYSKKNFEHESLMLTGDLNVAVVEWITQYRIRNPYFYLFRVKNPRQTFRDMNEAIMREVVGDKTVTEVLTVGRQEIADKAKKKLQELCDQYQTGIVVEQIVLQDANPPDPVKPSFNEVNQAQQEKERMINEAWAEYNKVIPKAKGQALQTIEEAKGYAADRINRAKGDALFFEQILKAYQAAPLVTRTRLFIETMEDLYPHLNQKIIVDEDVKGLIPFLNLNKKGE